MTLSSLALSTFTSYIRATPLIPKQKYTSSAKYSDTGAFAHPLLNSSNLIYIASELTSGV